MNQSNLPNIQIHRISRLRGPNIWSNRPVLEAWVDLGVFEEYPSDKLEGFTDRLMRWLPSLIEHRCSEGVRGGFLTRLRDGTWMGHVLEHVTLELQTLAHRPVGYGRARETGRYGVYRVVIECLEPEFGERCLAAGLDLIHAAARGQEFDIAACLAELRNAAARCCLEPNTFELAAAAVRLGFPALRLSTGNLVQIGYGKNGRRAWSAQTDRTAAVAGAISQTPELRQRLLTGVGIPTTDAREVDTMEEGWDAARDMEGVVTLRPAGKRRSPGLSALEVAAGKASFEAAYKTLVHGSSGAIVEKWVSGSLHRVLVVGDRAVAACRVTEAGSVDVTSAMHPEVAAACVLAARTIGLDVAGIDVVATDIQVALAHSGGAVVDVSANPDLMLHTDVRHPSSPPVGEAIVRHLFDGAVDPEFPVYAVSGAGAERSRIAALVAESLERCRGSRTALVGQMGIRVSGELVQADDARNRDSAFRVLTHPLLEAAVFDVVASQVINEGLPFFYCNVAVVLSTAELGAVTGPWESPPYLNAEFVRKAVRAPADVVPANGWLVLDAGEEGIATMAERCPGRVLYFGTDPTNELLRKHVAAGEKALTVVENQLVYIAGPGRSVVGSVSALDQRALGIVMPCIAVLLCSGVTLDVVARELLTLVNAAAEQAQWH
jgi:cyanophycin synthetase